MGLLKGTTMSDKTLLLSDDGGVLTITVNRPDALNALNAVVLTELCTLLEGRFPLDGGDLRGVILTGAGPG
jgi:enoyl-CoA hydratase